MKKRILASLMALCLIVGLLPTAALAVDPGTEQESAGDPAGIGQEQIPPVPEDAVTQPEGDGNGAADAEEPREETPPISEAAPAAAADGYTNWANKDSLPTSGTYRLTSDVTIKPTFSKYATVTKSLVLDLAGHTVTVNDEEGGEYAYFVNSSNASLVIEDSVGGGKITNAGTNDRMLTLIQVNSGSFELKGGTLKNTSSMGYALYVNSSSTLPISIPQLALP